VSSYLYFQHRRITDYTTISCFLVEMGSH
jgi:hypothetical protein